MFIGLLILPARSRKLVVLSTSDLHPKLTEFGPENAYSLFSVSKKTHISKKLIKFPQAYM